MKSLNQIASETLSVCDGCSNWRICKYSEDVKRAEKQFMLTQEQMNWPECVESMLSCKYKQYYTNGLWLYRENYNQISTGNSPFRYDEGATCNTVE